MAPAACNIIRLGKLRFHNAFRFPQRGNKVVSFPIPTVPSVKTSAADAELSDGSDVTCIKCKPEKGVLDNENTKYCVCGSLTGKMKI